MKKNIILFLTIALMSFCATANWTPVAKEQAEYNAIMQQIVQIQGAFARTGGHFSSGALQSQIFQFLKSIGTPVSYKILQEMVASGRLNRSYLNAA